MVNSKGYSAVHYAAYHGNKQNLELVSKQALFSAFSVEFQRFQVIGLHFGQILHLVLKRSFIFQLLEMSFNALGDIESSIPVSPLHLAVSAPKPHYQRFLSYVHNPNSSGRSPGR